MLFEPSRHEALRVAAWDETRARDAIGRIVAEAERAFDPASLWPVHPLDGNGLPLSLYMGAAGVIWAIDHLVELGVVQKQRDWAPIVESLAARFPGSTEAHPKSRHSFAFGETGLALAGHRVTRAPVWRERMLEAARENLAHPSNELFLGTPGTLLAASALHDDTGDARLREIVDASAARVQAQLQFDTGSGCALWTQHFDENAQMLGAVHGFAGNVCALQQAGQAGAIASEIERTLEATARSEGEFVNWPQSVRSPWPDRAEFLVQICHGAPGVIVALARFETPPDSRLDALLRAGGELTWRAGPLVKGSNLCHGTAGNGYAFLCLYRRTGDAIWLERARAFAMHVIAQWEDERARHGVGRFSLWTGDPGLACFLWDCIRERDAFPTLHAF